jgi:hypothetical protein
LPDKRVRVRVLDYVDVPVLGKITGWKTESVVRTIEGYITQETLDKVIAEAGRK